MYLDPAQLVVPWEWEAPMWWAFLPSLQGHPEPDYMQWIDYGRVESFFRENSLHQALGLIGEDTKKQLMVTCVLLLTTCFVWLICTSRWWNYGHSISVLVEEENEIEKTIKEVEEVLKENPLKTFQITETGVPEHAPQCDKNENNQLEIPRPIDNSVPKRRYLFPARNMLDALKKDEGKIDQYSGGFNDCLPQYNFEHKQKDSEVLVGTVETSKTSIDNHCLSFRKSQLFSTLCNFWEESVYTLPGRLWSGLAGGFSREKIENPETMPRYVKVWYAPGVKPYRHIRPQLR